MIAFTFNKDRFCCQQNQTRDRKMKSLAKCEGIEYCGYFIPPFDWQEGELLRLYVQIIPVVDGYCGYAFSQTLIKLFEKKLDLPGLWVKQAVPFANYIQQNKLSWIVNPLTVDRFLLKRNKIDAEWVNEIKSLLDLNGNEKIGMLGATVNKMLSICAMCTNDNQISFEYYGLDWMGTQKLNVLLEQLIKSGKSLIGLDNYYYYEKEESFEQIKPVIVKRK